jgi:peptidyl-prolyl cis-trans isomerase SurA
MRMATAIRLVDPLGQAKMRVVLTCLMFAGAALQSCRGQAAVPAETPQTSSPVVLDRAVAVVNRHLILASDLEDEIRISVLEPNQGTGEMTPRRALEELISRTLIEQQIRQGEAQTFEPTADEVAARLHELRKQLPVCLRQNCATDAGWANFLAAHGLTTGRVEAYLRYRMEILSFIEQRFRQGIQISQQQIETYYHGTLLPQYGATDTVPSLKEVAPRIQEILLQQQVNQMFDVWLTNLREQGDVQVLDPSLAPADPKSDAGSGDE